MTSTAGWPLFYAGPEGATIAHCQLCRKLKGHIDDNAPLTEDEVNLAAADPSCLAFVAIRIGRLFAGSQRDRAMAGSWPEAFARANRLAEELVIRQTRLLTLYRAENWRLKEELEDAREEAHG
jgi:hypothetical protein